MDSAYVTTKGQLVVPARIRRKYGIKPGTKVYFVEHGDQILFQPVTREFIRSVRGMLRSTDSVGEELVRDRKMEKESRGALLEKTGTR